jgi:DNA ligase (NAD+)
VSELGDKGLIKEVAGLFRLREEDLHQLENFLENIAERSAQKLVKTIQSRIIIPLHGFVYALGIPEVGKVVAGDLPISFNPWIDFVSQIHTT